MGGIPRRFSDWIAEQIGSMGCQLLSHADAPLKGKAGGEQEQVDKAITEENAGEKALAVGTLIPGQGLDAAVNHKRDQQQGRPEKPWMDKGV